MKTCVIIPTYNEAKSISEIVGQIRKQNLDAIVIDDGSSDNTSQLAQNDGAVVLRNPVNQGKGASLIRGFQYALRKDFDAVITMDGDGQHKPSDIPYFMRIAKFSNNSFFIGNRMANLKSMPWIRIMTNKFMSWFLSKIIGQKVFDTQCGFRLIKKDLLKRITLKTTKYETESEILINASRLGFRIESIPIETVYLGGKSRINPIMDSIRFMKFILTKLWTTHY